MRSWICACGRKNDWDAQACYVCGDVTTVVVKTPKPLKRTPVNKVSDKRKDQNAAYTQARASWIAGKRCACCGDPAGEVHHKKGRTNELLLEKKYWLPVCRPCHILITEDSEWAIREGYSLPRTVTEKPTK